MAFPLFCSAPVVIGFAGIGLAHIFKHYTLLIMSPWLAALLVELLLLGAGCWLWHQGQKREAMARNPWQGGFIEAFLREKYGRPRI